MDTVTLARQLIDIPSISGEEQQILEVLEQHCTCMGMAVEREYIEKNRWNLYAGWTEYPQVLFTTHVDTVPPFSPSRVEEDRLYGRGSCDTKGIIAAMLSACCHIREHGAKPALLFVVGEETDSIGAKTAASGGRRAQYIVNGEPTENMLASAHKGVLSYTLQTTGQAAHSAYPERGHSAIHTLLNILHDIINAEWGENHEFGASTLNIGIISGGNALNTFAPSASATVMHRLVDDAELRKQQVERLVGREAEIQFHSVTQPQRLHTVQGFETVIVNYGTDIPYLQSLGTCLMLGPGSIHQAHSDNEYVGISELHKAVDLYIELFERLYEAA